MYIMISLDCKFKTNLENIERVLQHYGLRKIQSSLYAGEMNNNERENMAKNINYIIRETDNVLMMPICKNCYEKKVSIGREIKFRDELYRVY